MSDEDVERETGADRQRGLLQPFAGFGTERVGAGQPLAVAEQGEVAVGLGVGARVDGGLGDVGEAHGRADRVVGGADGGGLRIGEGDARDGLVVRLARLAEDVGGDDPGPGTRRRGSAARDR